MLRMILPVVACGLAMIAGCGDAKTPDKTKTAAVVAKPATFHVCHDCGLIEIDDKHVCPTDGEKCPKCKMVKGSPGCCQDGHMVVCKGCGVAYDSNKGGHVCSITDECPKCKRQHGSPGCCIEDKAKETAGKTSTPKPAQG